MDVIGTGYYENTFSDSSPIFSTTDVREYGNVYENSMPQGSHTLPGNHSSNKHNETRKWKKLILLLL
jgi:hypothetical protein